MLTIERNGSVYTIGRLGPWTLLKGPPMEFLPPIVDGYPNAAQLIYDTGVPAPWRVVEYVPIPESAPTPEGGVT